MTEIVKNYKVCLLTNAVANEKEPGTQYWTTKAEVYQEIDLIEAKPGKFSYKYL